MLITAKTHPNSLFIYLFLLSVFLNYLVDICTGFSLISVGWSFPLLIELLDL